MPSFVCLNCNSICNTAFPGYWALKICKKCYTMSSGTMTPLDPTLKYCDKCRVVYSKNTVTGNIYCFCGDKEDWNG